MLAFFSFEIHGGALICVWLLGLVFKYHYGENFTITWLIESSVNVDLTVQPYKFRNRNLTITWLIENSVNVDLTVQPYKSRYKNLTSTNESQKTASIWKSAIPVTNYNLNAHYRKNEYVNFPQKRKHNIPLYHESQSKFLIFTLTTRKMHAFGAII